MLVESLDLADKIKNLIINQDGITDLYPPQGEAIKKGLLTGKNLVISIPTAAGKTLLAELAALKHVLELNGKVIYLCPLRALASEKYKDFKRFSMLGVRTAITSGDYDSTDDYLPKYDIIVSTNEKFDALLRHRASWITEEVSLVIIDECHLINDQHRGPTLETLLARLLVENTVSQIIALSATVGNADEIAEWLDAELVKSDWRPVPLKEGVYFEDQITYSDYTKREVPFHRDDPIVNLALDSIQSQEQMLVFAPSRRTAVSKAEKLGSVIESFIEPNEAKKLAEIASQVILNLSDPLSKKLADTIKKGVAFHHAGLNSRQREIVESGFKAGLIKTICATPTLAAGVNLPAKRVIVSSVYRYSVEEGSHPIKTLEYKQMCLPEGTPIVTPFSENKIENIKIGDKIISYSSRGKLVEDEVQKIYERTTNEVYEIKTSLGIDLVGTKEHPVWTPLGWRTIGELKPNDRIAYINKIDRRPIRVHMFDLLPKEGTYIKDGSWFFNEVTKVKGWGKWKLAQYLKIKHPGSVYHYRKGKKATKITWILKLARLLDIQKDEFYSKIDLVKSAYGNPLKISWLTPEFMWLVGIIVSDGNINAGKDKRSGSLSAKVRIYNTNMKILQKAQSILKTINIDVKIKPSKNPKNYQIEFGNTLLAHILGKCGVTWKKKSYNVFIPDFFYCLNEQLLWAYFSGVFDGDGNLTARKEQYMYSIRISTASKPFAMGLHKLLLRLGIVSSIVERKIDNKTLIRGEKVHFRAKNYIVIFRKKKDLIKFKQNGFITKNEIPDIRYSDYNNINNRISSKLPVEYVKIKKIEKRNSSNRKVYNFQTKTTNTYFANNFLVHNCGRAGRPQFDKEGESILLAKKPEVLDWLMDRYINRDAEDIYSKLAAKPALRRNILGLIASRVVTNVSDLLNFFEKTFYGYQFEAVFLEGKIREVVDLLIGWQMIRPLDANETLEATQYGIRVSQLYLDPETAASIAEGLTCAVQQKRTKIHPVALLDLVVGTPDMITLSFRKNDWGVTEKRFSKFSSRLIQQVPDSDDIEYEFRLRDFRTTLFLWDWIKELPIEKLIMRYNIGSGDIRRIVETGTWVVSATAEIAELYSRKDKKYKILAKAAQTLSERVEYGIESDGVSLTRIRGIGRKRARTLMNHGIRDITKLLTLNAKDLAKVPGFGSELAETILKEGRNVIHPKKEVETIENGLENFLLE